jgi:hypothetical protein
MFKFFWNNLSKRFLVFGLPLIIALPLAFIKNAPVNYGNIITAFSIILMLNVTALFQISKKVLTDLFRAKNKNGDSYYKILKNKYEVVIYFSFIYIAGLLCLIFPDVNVLFYGMNIINFIVLYFLLLLIILNITLVKYYFDTLYAELKSPDNTNKN